MKPVPGASRSEKDGTAPRGDFAEGLERQRELVFAIGHEIGNHLGAIRLQAHLLDEDLDRRALATASIEIDGLAGRAAPLLALLRPILASDPPIGAPTSWKNVLGPLSRQLGEDGTRGVRVDVRIPPAEGAREAPGADWLASLLIALVGATIADLPRRATLRLWLEARDVETALILEDDGADEDLSPEAPLRGRSLAVSIARWLVGGLGGRVDARRLADRTRVELVFPPPD